MDKPHKLFFTRGSKLRNRIFDSKGKRMNSEAYSYYIECDETWSVSKCTYNKWLTNNACHWLNIFSLHLRNSNISSTSKLHNSFDSFYKIGKVTRIANCDLKMLKVCFASQYIFKLEHIFVGCAYGFSTKNELQIQEWRNQKQKRKKT